MSADTPGSEALPAQAPSPERRRAAWLYLLLFFAIAGACGLAANFALWSWQISVCRYPPARPGFLAYCGHVAFGDYEHGAFAWGWRKQAVAALQSADILVLGSSTAQVAFSTEAVSSFFQQHRLPYYLLGFGFGEQYGFAEALFKRYNPHPKVVILNIDPYFNKAMSPVAEAVIGGSFAERASYWRKWLFVALQPLICRFPGRCEGPNPAYYRDDLTGAWIWKGVWYAADRSLPMGAVPPNPFGPELMHEWSQAADRFIATLGVDRGCVILTSAPIANYETGPIAQEIGRTLGLSVRLPHIENVGTLDGSHLSGDSAERWSAQFLVMSAAQIERCTHQGS